MCSFCPGSTCRLVAATAGGLSLLVDDFKLAGIVFIVFVTQVALSTADVFIILEVDVFVFLLAVVVVLPFPVAGSLVSVGVSRLLPGEQRDRKSVKLATSRKKKENHVLR